MLKDWKKVRLFDGVKYLHKNKKMPSGSPLSIRIVDSAGSANYGTVILGNRKSRKFKTKSLALKYAKSYMRKH